MLSGLIGVATAAWQVGVLRTGSWVMRGLRSPARNAPVAGVAMGLVEAAQHTAVASLAPADLRGSAFGALAAIQSVGNLAASAVAGALWTLVSPRAAFLYLAAWSS